MVDLLVSTVSGLGRSVAEAAEVSLMTLHVQYYVLHLIRDHKINTSGNLEKVRREAASRLRGSKGEKYDTSIESLERYSSKDYGE